MFLEVNKVHRRYTQIDVVFFEKRNTRWELYAPVRIKQPQKKGRYGDEGDRQGFGSWNVCRPRVFYKLVDEFERKSIKDLSLFIIRMEEMGPS